MNTHVTGTLCAAAMLLGAGAIAAQAGTIALHRESFSGQAVSISTNSGSSYQSVTGGRFTWSDRAASDTLDIADLGAVTTPASDLITFCIEAFETVGSNATYDVVDIWDAPKDNGGTNPSPMGIARATLLTKLANHAIDTFGAAIGSWTTAQIVPFQIAIWEVVNEQVTPLAGVDIDTGNFRVTSGNATWLSDADSLLSAAVGFAGPLDYSLGGLSSPSGGLTAVRQDQMYFMQSPPPPPIIPTPTAAAAGLLGLGLLAARRQAKA
ncbi:hypothetical protein [Mucisphaera sp.]|uniref:hypothetical protein n=1 Tax=Mucisphaera sp. TaxID=2913024 RepID=UPI003D13D2E6